ncbi:MAG TPA: Ig-like domain-containing protein [bacterium]|nr:Ig-like domain-containing protein [bacterium]HMW36051.1 Ig-like domain-containing protein [bacterium]HMZ04775.1 Ig-like domain-containing protein [bacterium]HNB08324.1 Ig-like domain-containing protein [bacterium]HNB57192.1 Ig-like domain-containing protein [bacterium]
MIKPFSLRLDEPRGWGFVLLLLCGCATIGAPGGGPEDKEPPTVITTFPAKDSTGVSRQTEVTVTFSEAMNKASVEKALFIAPFPARDPDLSWDDATLTIRFKDALEENRTCVITIGTDAMDAHQNKFKSAWSFAFSTGDKIDAGSIAGTVVSESKTKPSVWAYRLNGHTSSRDSMIYTKRADYITQVDAQGKYRFSYLADGAYRIYAVSDQGEDFRYHPMQDMIGLAPRDVILADTSKEALFVDIAVFREDTTTMAVQLAQMTGPNEVLIRINNVLAESRYDGTKIGSEHIASHFSIRDSLSGTDVAIRDVYFVTTGATEEIRLLCDSMSSQRVYVLDVRGIYGLSGDSIAFQQINFRAEGGFETLRAKIEWTFPYGTPGLIAVNDFIGWKSDRGLDRPTWEKAFVLRDTLGNSVNGTFFWMHSASGKFIPARNLRGRMPYEVHVDGKILQDWSGRPAFDTTMVWRLVAMPEDTVGTVSGMIADESSDDRGMYHITARNLNRSGRDYTLIVPSPGGFTLDGMLPGKYNFLAFRDRDSNGVFSFGQTAPIIRPERFTSYSDTVTVRKNWETSNIQIRFRK